jgi:hypothetical protein
MCRGCGKTAKSGWQVVRPWMGSGFILYFSKQLQLIGLYNGDRMCLLRGRGEFLNISFLKFVLQRDLKVKACKMRASLCLLL